MECAATGGRRRLLDPGYSHSAPSLGQSLHGLQAPENLPVHRRLHTLGLVDVEGGSKISGLIGACLRRV